MNTSIRLDHLNVITFAGQHDFIFQVMSGPVAVKGDSVSEERPKTIVEQKSPSLPASLGKEEPAVRADEVTDIEKTRMGDQALPLPALNEDEADDTTGEEASVQTTPTVPIQYVLTVRGLADDHLEYTLSEGENVVGRSDECEVHIEDGSLSRKHAIIEISNDTATIRDLGSKNGTYIDDEAVLKPTTVNPGNQLKFGYRVEATLSRK